MRKQANPDGGTYAKHLVLDTVMKVKETLENLPPIEEDKREQTTQCPWDLGLDPRKKIKGTSDRKVKSEGSVRIR